MVPAIGSRANAKILTARPAGLRYLPLQDDLVYHHRQPAAMVLAVMVVMHGDGPGATTARTP
jgi:hypothetical protein